VFLCAGLSFINRPDSAPLFLPPLLFVLWRDRAELTWKQAILGFAPAVAWLFFATFYYGFPFPNTAYAKLNTHIPRHELARQGVAYLLETAQDDPGLAIVIVVGFVSALLSAKGETTALRRLRAGSLVAALLAGILYVVVIGGDFMAGRFLTPVAALAAASICLCADDWLAAPHAAEWATAVTGLVLVTLPFSPWREDRSEPKREFPAHRVVDERGWYREHLTLALNLRPTLWKEYGLYGDGRAARERKESVVVFNNIGMFSWGAGPETHVVDELALTDPLLARLPFEYRPDWRPGHLPRPIPEGYVRTLREGRNVIEDPCIHAYYDKLRAIVRGPLFSAERFGALLALNLPGGATIQACPRK
jgi:arabinofuranosyltransferase